VQADRITDLRFPLKIVRDRAYWGVFLLAGLLLFCSLGRRYLWQDEAETALLGRNILRYGVPLASDGTNVVSQEAGREFVAGSRWPYFLWRWSPWVQYYLAAGSMLLLGPTTLAARLPFAALAFCSVPLTYSLARRLFGSRLVAGLIALCLVANVPFLLHARQARWCAPAFVLVVALLLSATALARGTRRAWAGLAVAGTLLFYTNYLVAIGALAALLPAVTVLAPGRTALRGLAAAYAATATLTLPGVVFLNVLGRPGQIVTDQVANQLGACAGLYFTFLLPLPAAVLILYLCAAERAEAWLVKGWRRNALFLIVFSLVYALYLSLPPWLAFRYLCAVVPVAAILLGLGSAWIFTRNRPLGVALLLVVLTTDFLHGLPLGWLGAPGTQVRDRFPSLGPVSSPLAGFVYELGGSFAPPERSLSDYLRIHARPTDVVLTTYDDLPLQFYTGLRVTGGLQGQPLPDDPDWIVLRQTILSLEPGKDLDVLRFVQTRIELRRYRPVDFRHRDYTLGNNPDPRFHLFRAPDRAPPLLLLHRVPDDEDAGVR
jgi:hypothetical protein